MREEAVKRGAEQLHAGPVLRGARLDAAGGAAGPGGRPSLSRRAPGYLGRPEPGGLTMNDQEKRDYLERYQAQKAKGRPFFPDILFKAAAVSLLVLLVLVALSHFVGAPLEARANPNDSPA